MKMRSNIITKLKSWQIKMLPQSFRVNSPKAMLIFTLFLCIILNFIFLQPVLKSGLTGDDWDLLFAYKTFPQPLNRVLDVWMIKGPYITTYFYYIGILEGILGLNYQLFQIINICFKIFASMTLFLLISKVFKDYFLASVSAIIFSIIHSSAGALAYVVKGTEYLAIGFMNLFFIFYYHTVAKNSVKLTLFTSVILFIGFIFSPIRLYPLFGLIFLIEIYLMIKNKKISYLLQSFFRLAIFYLPVVFLAGARRSSYLGYLNGAIDYVNGVKEGSWHYLLLPFNALGYSLLGNDQLNFLHIPAYLIGIFIFICSAIAFIIWIKKGSKLNKLFLLFFGSFFAFFFIISTMLILGPAFNIISSLHWYLIVPSLGISIFISALICLLIKQGMKLKRDIYLLAALLLFMTIAFVSYYEITRHFNYLLSIGTGASDQTYMQNQILNSINNQNQLNLIIYMDMDVLTDPNIAQYYAVASNLGYLPQWLLYFKKPELLGCIAVITDKKNLMESFKVGDLEYFEANAFCAETRYNIGMVKTIYETRDFRAFMLKDKKMFNITDQVLQELRSQ